MTFELATRLERARETIYRSSRSSRSFLTDFDKGEIKFIGIQSRKSRPQIFNINKSFSGILFSLFLICLRNNQDDRRQVLKFDVQSIQKKVSARKR